MSSRLDHIKDWKALAAKANYKLGTMARMCQVSDRQLRRYFQNKFACGAKVWIDATRAEAAAQPAPVVVKTGSTDRHLISDEPILPQPVQRPRTYRDLDHIADDFD